MNKEYERVGEEIAKQLCKADGWAWERIKEKYINFGQTVAHSTYHRIADQILSIKGIAILSDDQSLPRAMPHFISSNSLDDKVLFAQYKQSQQDMLKAGFVKVVKEE